MAQITSFGVHSVKSISVEQKQFPSFWAVEFTLTSADGSTATVVAYTAGPLTIDGLEPVTRVVSEEVAA